MRLYGTITKVDAEQRMVWGYASTEAVDSDGEVIKRSAIDDALEDYMKFGNIREMHQPSAVGVTKDAFTDEKGLYIAAKVVDNDAWAKVQEGVYKGFSIGGKVLERDPKARKTITKIGLYEISLVDRPANPEATFDVWKAAHIEESSMSTPAEELAKAEDEVVKTEVVVEGEVEVVDESLTAEGAEVEKSVEADPIAKAEAAVAELKAVVDAYNVAADSIDLLANAIEKLAELSKADESLLPLVDLIKAAQATKAEAEAQAKADEAAKAVANEDLAKAKGEGDKFAKALGSLTEQVGLLTKRLAEVEAQPLPPKTAGVHAVTKQDDASGAARKETPELSDEEVAKALASMDPDDRAMALMKATLSFPIPVR